MVKKTATLKNLSNFHSEKNIMHHVVLYVKKDLLLAEIS